MALSLFAHPFSSYCQKALVALYENGTPFTYRLLDQGEPENFAEFAALCFERAGRTPSLGRPATNGMIVEQEQILTTHNLAVLTAELGLRDMLAPRAVELARRCVDFALVELQRPDASWSNRLHAVKNSAYAFRQMIFFLSIAGPAAQKEAIALAWARLAEQPHPFQARFRPALEGLARAARGLSPESPPEARRFLGWDDGKHWLLA